MQPQNAPRVRWEWIGEAWELFTRQWSAWVLMILLMYLIVFAVYLPFLGVITAMMPVPQQGEVPEFPTGIFALYPVIYLVVVSALAWLMGGLYRTAFKQLRGEQIVVGDLFSGGQYFGRMLGAMILIGIFGSIGAVFCIIPGLIVYGLTMLTYPLIVEGGRGTIDAIRDSIEVTKRDWAMFTLFWLAVALLASLGALACGVGVLATMPLLFLTHALAYRDCVGMSGAPSHRQFVPPPPPDYRSSMPAYESAPPMPAPPPPESTTVVCPHCGATLLRAANFCNQCGGTLGPR
jgi:uncharacterized RDD family membrane protein YckC